MENISNLPAKSDDDEQALESSTPGFKDLIKGKGFSEAQKQRFEKAKEVLEESKTGAKPLKKLTSKHHKVIFFYLQGVSVSEIAAEMSLTISWVSTILADPLAKEIIEAHHNSVRNELKSLSGRAVQAQREILESKNERNRLRASEIVLKANGLLEEKSSEQGSVKELMSRALQRISDRSEKINVRMTETTRSVEVSKEEKS